MLESAAAEADLMLTTELPTDLPPVDADPDRLLQVLSNLVGNAMKFTPAGGCICIRATDDAGFVRLSVVDTGPGIPAEQLPNIFRKFWQANTGDRRGIGFGLSIVQGLVEAHGGRVWVESEVGTGSTFHFTVPATAARASRAPFDGSADYRLESVAD